jgi:hypothetical protein
MERFIISCLSHFHDYLSSCVGFQLVKPSLISCLEAEEELRTVERGVLQSKCLWKTSPADEKFSMFVWSIMSNSKKNFFFFFFGSTGV